MLFRKSFDIDFPESFVKKALLMSEDEIEIIADDLENIFDEVEIFVWKELSRYCSMKNIDLYYVYDGQMSVINATNSESFT